jgi:hypothetical protein
LDKRATPHFRKIANQFFHLGSITPRKLRQLSEMAKRYEIFSVMKIEASVGVFGTERASCVILELGDKGSRESEQALG